MADEHHREHHMIARITKAPAVVHEYLPITMSVIV
jgi:hypothetical protein